MEFFFSGYKGPGEDIQEFDSLNAEVNNQSYK